MKGLIDEKWKKINELLAFRKVVIRYSLCMAAFVTFLVSVFYIEELYVLDYFLIWAMPVIIGIYWYEIEILVRENISTIAVYSAIKSIFEDKKKSNEEES